jgi:hypothetical protein
MPALVVILVIAAVIAALGLLTLDTVRYGRRVGGLPGADTGAFRAFSA